MKQIINIPKEHLYQLYIIDKKNYAEIGDIYHCSSSVVYKFIKKYKLPLQGKRQIQKYLNIQREQLIELYIDQHMSQREVAKKLNCHQAWISSLFKKFKIRARSMSEACAKLHIIDIKNQIFGYLTVIDFVQTNERKNAVWRCQCRCGIIKNISGPSLLQGKVRSCGCLRKEIMSNSFNEKNKNWKGYEEISGSIWSSIKSGAASRNLEFSIKIEEAWDLFLKQDRKCALTSWPIHLNYDELNKSLKTASLDRIDSDKGYTIDNIQWIHKDINFIKSDFDQKYFIKMCEAVYHTFAR